MKHRYLTLLFLFLAAGLTAQAPIPSLLVDINTGAEGSSPRNFFPYNGGFLFRAETESAGVEPWFSDGTAEGTMMLADINTDPDLSVGNSNPDNYTLYNGLVYFKARAAGLGDELWVTDGTPEGTRLVKDIQPGEGNSNPFDLIVYNGLLYFTANDGENSSELWVSDGTEEGTNLVVDIRPGNAPGNPNFKTIYNGRLYFTANDGTNGNELWSSDGTAEGTGLLIDLRTSGNGNASPGQYFVNNGLLFFRANDGETGTEPYVTDGTAAGTRQLLDIREGSGSSSPTNFFNIGGLTFFNANDGEDRKLYATNATQTVQYNGALNDEPIINPGSVTDLIAGNQVILVAETDSNEIFYYGFIQANQVAFVSFEEVLDALEGDEPEDIVYTGTRLYFSYENAERGRELGEWNAFGDGSITALPEIVDGPTGGDIDDIFLAGTQLYFEANDTVTGRELWTLTPRGAFLSLTDEAGTAFELRDTIEFGPVAPGFSTTTSIIVLNSGSDSTTVLADDVGSQAGAFSTAYENAPAEGPAVLPPGADNANRINVIFAPGMAGTFVDSIRVNVNSASGAIDRYMIILVGTTEQPVLGLSEGNDLVGRGDVLDFTEVPERVDSVRTLTVTNVGNVALVIDSVRLDNAVEFQASDLTDTLAAGETADITVTLNSEVVGDFSDVLRIFSSDTSDQNVFVVNLNGNVIINSVVELGLEAARVFPNPAVNAVNVELAEPLDRGNWRLVDGQGRVVANGVWPAGQLLHRVETATLPTGVYQLEISSGTRRLTARVMKR